MKLIELKKELENRRVSKYDYGLSGGFPNEAFVIDNNNGFWEVYYSEKGMKTGLKRFSSEDEACQYMLKIILENL